jgi:hypothetical protein
MYVCLQEDKMTTNGQIFMKFDIRRVFENLPGNLKFTMKPDKNNLFFT